MCSIYNIFRVHVFISDDFHIGLQEEVAIISKQSSISKTYLHHSFQSTPKF